MTENPYANDGPSWLADLWMATQYRKDMQGDLDRGYEGWKAMIRKAVESGHRVTDVAKAADVSRERVYQILGEE